MSFAAMLTSSATVSRPSATVDALGDQTDTMTAVTAAMPCRVTALSAREREALGSESTVVTHRISCLSSADVQERDELTIGGATYRVQFVERSMGASAVHHLKLICQEIRRG